MSAPMYDRDVDEMKYEMYLSWCRARHETPSIKDYLVWLDEQGYDDDLPEYE